MAYLKSFVYGDMVNNAWKMPNAYSGSVNGYSCDYLTSEYCRENGASLATMTITPIYKDYIVPYYQSLNSNGSTLQRSDVAYVGDSKQPYEISFYTSSRFKPDALASLASTNSRTSFSTEEQAFTI